MKGTEGAPTSNTIVEWNCHVERDITLWIPECEGAIVVVSFRRHQCTFLPEKKCHFVDGKINMYF